MATTRGGKGEEGMGGENIATTRGGKGEEGMATT